MGAGLHKWRSALVSYGLGNQQEGISGYYEIVERCECTETSCSNQCHLTGYQT
jgi:hypothetical protein